MQPRLQGANLSKPRNNRAYSILAGWVGRKMAWKSIVKLANRNQFLDSLREIRTHIARCTLDFSHQFGTAIDNGNQIFKVSTRVKIIPTPSGEGFDAL